MPVCMVFAMLTNPYKSSWNPILTNKTEVFPHPIGANSSDQREWLYSDHQGSAFWTSQTGRL